MNRCSNLCQTQILPSLEYLFSPCLGNYWLHTIKWLDKLKLVRNIPIEYSEKQKQLGLPECGESKGKEALWMEAADEKAGLGSECG